MRSSIGGPLDPAALGALSDYERQPPPDRDTCRAAAMELRNRGFTPLDIAAALRLSKGAVLELLGEARR